MFKYLLIFEMIHLNPFLLLPFSLTCGKSQKLQVHFSSSLVCLTEKNIQKLNGCFILIKTNKSVWS